MSVSDGDSNFELGNAQKKSGGPPKRRDLFDLRGCQGHWGCHHVNRPLPTVSQRSRYAPIAEERRTDSAWCPEPGAAPANLRGTTSRIRSTLRIDKDGRMILSCRQQVCSFHPLSCLGPRAT